MGSLGITTPVIGFNGGVIASPDMAIIIEHLLSPEVARQAVEMLPLDAEVVLVDRVVKPPGEIARTLTATPGIHVGATNVGVRVDRGRTPRKPRLSATT